MSLQTLAIELRNMASGAGGIVLNEDTFAKGGAPVEAAFDGLLKSALSLGSESAGLQISVSPNSIPDPVDTVLSFTGKTNVLNLTGIEVAVSLTEAGNQIQVVLVFTLPADWTFATSFRFLTGMPFEALAITKAFFVFSNVAIDPFESDGNKISIARGLNFAATVDVSSLSGVLALVASLIGERTTFPLFGTVEPSVVNLTSMPPTLYPALNLQAPFSDGKIEAETLELSSPGLFLDVNPRVGPKQVVWLTFGFRLRINNDVSLRFLAPVAIANSSLRFGILPDPEKPVTVDDIVLLAGADVAASIPSELREAFASISLAGFLADIVPTLPPKVSSLSVALQAAHPFSLGPGFKLESIVLSLTVIDPFGSRLILASFAASLTFLRNLFPGVFTVEAAAQSGGSLNVSGRYSGDVRLNDIVREISNNTINVPDDLASICFSDFYVNFSKAGTAYDWNLGGTAALDTKIPLAGGSLSAEVFVTVNAPNNGPRTYSLVGGFIIAGVAFNFTASIDGSKTRLEGSWKATGTNYLTLAGIAEALGLPRPDIPPDLDLNLESASISYEFRKKVLTLSASSKTYGKAVLVAYSDPASGWCYFFGFEIDRTISLSDLPLLDVALESKLNISVTQIQLLYVSTALLPDQPGNPIGLINGSIGSGFPMAPAAGLTQGPHFAVTCNFGGTVFPAITGQPLPGANSPTGNNVPAAGGTNVPAQAAADGTTWFNVQKSFGPVNFARVGVRYESSSQCIRFLLDASFAFGPITVSLTGLGAASPVKTFTPSFSLQGLGVSYQNPPLRISGGLINLSPPGSPELVFEGQLVIETGSFSVSAIGYYGTSGGYPSLFIFGLLAFPIGGPAPFFVTGVCGGLGYNSQVNVPEIGNVASFPFLAILPGSTQANSVALGGGNTPFQILESLSRSTPPRVAPQEGSLWLAAGLTFTTFDFVKSQALLVVEAGDDLIIALLGTAYAQVPPSETAPKGAPVYAAIQMELLAQLRPRAGIFSIQAVLSRTSFLFDRACVLTGGFAFFVWFDPDPNAGQFVLTVGGYHPAFARPSFYPAVPRVGFRWNIDSTLDLRGEAYFALTPAAFMAGGALSVTYSSGNLKAWLIAHLDVIVRWKPFYFDASIGITIGASYKLNLLFTSVNISIEFACDILLYGPPVGGRVTVDWTIISFSILFGPPRNPASSQLVWADVEHALPRNSSGSAPSIVSLNAAAGLSRTIDGATADNLEATLTSSTPTDTWIVRASAFAFTSSSAIPASTVRAGDSFTHEADAFDVYPLNWTGIRGLHEIAFKDSGGNDAIGAFEIVVPKAEVPSSLWGSPPQAADGTPKVPPAGGLLVSGTATGAQLTVKAPQLGSTAGPVDVDPYLRYDDLDLPNARLPISKSARPIGDVPAAGTTTVSTIADRDRGIASAVAIQAREELVNSLRTLGLEPAFNDDMAAFAGSAACMFSAEPFLLGR